jgi:hypothetical protein
VRLAGGSRTTIDVHLRPAGGPAHLIVSASVPDAVITVDGNRQPTSPIDLELPPGPHTVVIRASGYAEFERRVTLGATGAVHLDARLSRASHTGLAVGLGVAAGVAVIGGIVTTVILLQRPRQGDLGTLPPTTLPTIYE